LLVALGDGLNLGPLVDGPGAPKQMFANNFVAQQQQPTDPVSGLLSGLPLAGGLLSGLPLGQATSILNGLPLDSLVQTAQGAIPLGTLLGAAGGLGGLTNNLPLVGGVLGGQSGPDPLAALKGIVGSELSDTHALDHFSSHLSFS